MIYVLRNLTYSPGGFAACTQSNMGNLKIHRSKANADGYSHFHSYLSPLCLIQFRE